MADENNDFKYYIVSDFSSNGYPTLINFSDKGVESCSQEARVFDDDGNYIMNNKKEYNCSSRVIKHLLYSSNLFVVLRPTKLYNDISYRETKGKDLPAPKSGFIEYLLAAYDTTWISDINPYVVNMDFIDGEYHKAYYTPLVK